MKVFYHKQETVDKLRDILTDAMYDVIKTATDDPELSYGAIVRHANNTLVRILPVIRENYIPKEEGGD